METLTNEQMFATEGGDGWDSLGGALFEALLIMISL